EWIDRDRISRPRVVDLDPERAGLETERRRERASGGVASRELAARERLLAAREHHRRLALIEARDEGARERDGERETPSTRGPLLDGEALLEASRGLDVPLRHAVAQVLDPAIGDEDLRPSDGLERLAPDSCEGERERVSRDLARERDPVLVE